ncbi:MAG: dienelactone hydrolase family protein [Acidimicrobiales bacterium]
MRITLPSGNLAETAGSSTERGLVVVPDIMGLRPLFDDLVERLATEWDCTVVAPDLYAGQTDLDLQGRFAAASGLRDDDVLGDMVAAADATGAASVGAIGFCMGGMYVNKAVSTGRFDRLASFYGMIHVPDGWVADGQGEPLDHLGQGDPRTLLAVIGTDDPYTRPDEVAALAATGASIAAYEGADHGFVHDPDRPAHRAADAADAWRRVGDWLWG